MPIFTNFHVIEIELFCPDLGCKEALMIFVICLFLKCTYLAPLGAEAFRP